MQEEGLGIEYASYTSLIKFVNKDSNNINRGTNTITTITQDFEATNELPLYFFNFFLSKRFTSNIILTLLYSFYYFTGFCSECCNRFGALVVLLTAVVVVVALVDVVGGVPVIFAL